MFKKNIVLIGMPGAGKTTIGEILAKKLNITFIDVDRYIEKCSGKSISELFQKGENEFRKIEKKAVYNISKTQNCLISTGGGVIKEYSNIERLKKNGIIIFIDRPLENILKHVEMNNRPLLKDKNSLERLFNERYFLYKKYCDFHIINNCNMKEVISRITEVIK